MKRVTCIAEARRVLSESFGVSPSDPLTLAVVAAVLATVALLASLIPAYRASRLDPLQVLRSN